jgi:type II secretory pathway pseudopilin PulG
MKAKALSGGGISGTGLARVVPGRAGAHTRGFTLVELGTLLATITLLAALGLPLFSRAKTHARTQECLNHGQQLMLALHLYANDYQEVLPPNEDNNNQFDGWVAGDMTQVNQATNTIFLTDPRYAKLARYTAPDATLYHCPADQSTVGFGPVSAVLDQGSIVTAVTRPRVRSLSMNQAVGTKRDGKSAVDGSWLNEGTYGNNSALGGPYRTYGRLSAMTQPKPERLWVLIDEDPYGINDAGFAFTMHANATAVEWVDWPASYHEMGCGIAFADGHSELRHWLDQRTAVKNGDISRSTQPHNADLLWMAERTTARRDY